MSRLHEEPKQHIHSDTANRLNDLSIRIKLHYIINAEKRKQLADAGKMPPEPTNEEIAEILDSAVHEMNQCTKPYRVR